ncbi:hypothetical protein GCM10012280_37350 [Wenjunlia tyrosinilytica]|uniref:Superoxide dismutase n=1 Tax=Wenjunlia tyrosinilytica TaxID=1544741 RepID=A0A918DY38_9ACTN|nr:hypothetical protein GCM10012280_37350 [Wenjunlia tyrosinilytica]
MRLGAAVPAALVAGSALGAAAAHAAPARSFPTTIALPDGFQPEGITIGSTPYAYFGSLATGDVYRASLATGEGAVISKGPGTATVGLRIDHRGRLFLAGGGAGDARVVDACSGKILASYAFATGTAFVNDVVLTPDAAWFTDSYNAVLYALPLGPGGALPGPGQVVRLPLTGDWHQRPDFNANGITRTPDHRALLVVQATSAGLLHRVDPGTGRTRVVDLGRATLPNGDGMLLLGRTLYVVQQQQNAIDVFELDEAGTSGRRTTRITDPRFQIPTTVAVHGRRLYLPNARFDVEPQPTTTYTAVAVDRP